MKHMNFLTSRTICATLESRRTRTFDSRSASAVRAAVVLTLGVLLSTTTNAIATDTSSPLSGRWRAAETADEKTQREQAVDKATGNLRPMQRSRARSRLTERTSPPQTLTIEVEGSKVTIGSGDRELELELGGSSIEVPGNEGRARISATMEGEELIVVADSGNGERTTKYQADADRLTMQVTITGARLGGPLHFTTTYARTE
jgi:hypothetical protein